MPKRSAALPPAAKPESVSRSAKAHWEHRQLPELSSQPSPADPSLRPEDLRNKTGSASFTRLVRKVRKGEFQAPFVDVHGPPLLPGAICRAVLRQVANNPAREQTFSFSYMCRMWLWTVASLIFSVQATSFTRAPVEISCTTSISRVVRLGSAELQCLVW